MALAIKKAILIVEDDGLIGYDLQGRLEKLGYLVPAVAASGEEAIRFAQETAFDLALMDIRIKGCMDGITTAGILRSSIGLPVVYVTAHADEATVARATLTQPFGYLFKPVTNVSLSSAVQLALARGDMERRAFGASA